MFGLSTREILSKAIINSCHNCRQLLKNEIIANIDSMNNATEEELLSITTSINRQYFDAVGNSVISSFAVSSPKVYARIQLAILSPSICGYEDIDIEKGLMAGGLYAICYYALTNKVASPRECIKLNHKQNDIMNQVLIEIDGELA